MTSGAPSTPAATFMKRLSRALKLLSVPPRGLCGGRAHRFSQPEAAINPYQILVVVASYK